jgi:hypothetical protein
MAASYILRLPDVMLNHHLFVLSACTKRLDWSLQRSWCLLNILADQLRHLDRQHPGRLRYRSPVFEPPILQDATYAFAGANLTRALFHRPGQLSPAIKCTKAGGCSIDRNMQAPVVLVVHLHVI